jgi:hypothetical protein
MIPLDELPSYRFQASQTKVLLQNYGLILEELRRRGVIRSSNAPLGDYAEFLFSKAFDWQLQSNSKAGYDATAKNGDKFQIKSRRLTRHNKSRQLSFIRRLPEKHFDYLAGILFNEDFNIFRAALIPHRLIEPRSRFSKHSNGWLFLLKDETWDLPGVIDVTGDLRAAEE